MTKYVESLQQSVDEANRELGNDAKLEKECFAKSSDYDRLIADFKRTQMLIENMDVKTPIDFDMAEAIFSDPKFNEELSRLREKNGIEINSFLGYAICRRVNDDQIVVQCPELINRFISQASLMELSYLAGMVAGLAIDLDEDPYEKWEEYKLGAREENLFTREQLTRFYSPEAIERIYQHLNSSYLENF
jgi:hypothetical protein